MVPLTTNLLAVITDLQQFIELGAVAVVCLGVLGTLIWQLKAARSERKDMGDSYKDSLKNLGGDVTKSLEKLDASEEKRCERLEAWFDRLHHAIQVSGNNKG